MNIIHLVMPAEKLLSIKRVLVISSSVSGFDALQIVVAPRHGDVHLQPHAAAWLNRAEASTSSAHI